MKLYSNKKRSVSGDICILKFKVIIDREFDSKDEVYPWRLLENSNYDLKSEVDEVIKKTLGEQFEISSFSIGRGSIEIIAIIGTSYYVIANYKGFIESIELLVGQCKNVLHKFFSNRRPCNPSVTGSWIPTPELSRNEPEHEGQETQTNYFLLKYLVFSNAVMLGSIILYLFLKDNFENIFR